MARKPRSKRNRGPGRGSGPGRTRRPPTNRQFPRTARINALLHEIVAAFFERVDDDRFDLLTITGVEVDSDLNRAQVFVTTLGTVLASDPDDTGREDESGEAVLSPSLDADAELLEALAEYRSAVRRKIGDEARIRKTPEVVFAIDPGVRSGARIEEILATIQFEGSDEDPESVPPEQEI